MLTEPCSLCTLISTHIVHSNSSLSLEAFLEDRERSDPAVDCLAGDYIAAEGGSLSAVSSLEVSFRSASGEPSSTMNIPFGVMVSLPLAAGLVGSLF